MTGNFLFTIAIIGKNSQFSSRMAKVVELFFILTVSLLTSNPLSAKTNGIKFESGTWDEIKAKAIKENKLIFLDAYASWCGYCKKMAKDVFTNDTVADYFNANFINAKIDMETGEGIEIAKQYKIYVYPSLLFIDGQGNLVRRAEGALRPQPFIELAKEAQNPNSEHFDLTKEPETGNSEPVHTRSNKLEIGFNVSEYQKDFGVGIHIISPYFFMKTVAIKAGTNIQWLEYYNGSETTFATYQNIQLGMRGRSMIASDNISIYGEGGALIILPSRDISSLSSVFGGYGLLGFEFRVASRFAYFIELGGAGTGAAADKIAGKPIYSNGFLINVGLKIGF